MITDSQTHVVFISDRLGKCYPQIAGALESIFGNNLKIIPDTKDIWARDYMPIQIDTDRFVQFRYEPDYLKREANLRTENASDLIGLANCQRSDLNIDGGNIVRWSDAVVMTEKIYKENRSVKRPQLRRQLQKILGVERLIVIPMEPGDYIGHADGMVRFVDAKTLLVNDYAKVDPDFDGRLRKALGGFDIVAFPYQPTNECKNGIPSAKGVYINFLQTMNTIVVPTFGSRKRDMEAQRKLEEVFPTHKIIPVDCRRLAQEGGVLNCISWNIWRPEP